MGQVDTHLQMPCLPPAAVGTSPETLAQLPECSWTCSESLSWLLCRFFYFFVVEFSWGSEVVSVRLGKRAQRTGMEFAQLPGRWATRLHIEDPFLLSKNLNRVLGYEQEARLQAKLIEALGALRCGKAPAGLRTTGRITASIPHPLAKPLRPPQVRSAKSTADTNGAHGSVCDAGADECKVADADRKTLRTVGWLGPERNPPTDAAVPFTKLVRMQ